MNTEIELQINENMENAALKLSELLSEFNDPVWNNNNFKEHEYETYDEHNNEYNEDNGEYNVSNEIINIDDYVPAEEENEFGNFTSLINIFTCYFKQLFEKKQQSTIFDGLDYEKEDEKTGRCTSTNRCMEYMYEEIFKYNRSVEEDKDILYDPDSDLINIDNCDELFVLYVENDPKFVCKYILPILHHLSTIEWNNVIWSILKIKG